MKILLRFENVLLNIPCDSIRVRARYVAPERERQLTALHV